MKWIGRNSRAVGGRRGGRLGASRGTDRRAADAAAGDSAAGTGPAGDLQELHVLPRHRRLRVQRVRPRRLERVHRRAAQARPRRCRSRPPIASCCSTGSSASSARTTRPFPRTYVAQEVTTFFSDAEADEVLKRSCTSCHAIDRVNEARFSPDRWRVVTVDMRERGAKLADDELERLVEWLGRTKGRTRTNESR